MASQSIMFDSSRLQSNFEALIVDKFTYSSLIIVIVKENVQQPCPFLYTFFLQKCTQEGVWSLQI